MNIGEEDQVESIHREQRELKDLSFRGLWIEKTMEEKAQMGEEGVETVSKML